MLLILVFFRWNVHLDVLGKEIPALLAKLSPSPICRLAPGILSHLAPRLDDDSELERGAMHGATVRR